MGRVSEGRKSPGNPLWAGKWAQAPGERLGGRDREPESQLAQAKRVKKDIK